MFRIEHRYRIKKNRRKTSVCLRCVHNYLLINLDDLSLTSAFYRGKNSDFSSLNKVGNCGFNARTISYCNKVYYLQLMVENVIEHSEDPPSPFFIRINNLKKHDFLSCYLQMMSKAYQCLLE